MKRIRILYCMLACSYASHILPMDDCLKPLNYQLAEHRRKQKPSMDAKTVAAIDLLLSGVPLENVHEQLPPTLEERVGSLEKEIKNLKELMAEQYFNLLHTQKCLSEAASEDIFIIKNKITSLAIRHDRTVSDLEVLLNQHDIPLDESHGPLQEQLPPDEILPFELMPLVEHDDPTNA